MSLRFLSVTLPVAFLFFFSAFVVAQVNVTATCTKQSYSWTFNSIDQSPCLVAANMLATCYQGSYTLEPLPSGYVYDGASPDYSNKCECSTVGYSLISACEACQGLETDAWSDYVANCTSILPPSQFPNPVPAGTRVPHWVILDVTEENNWNDEKSYADGIDNPEYGPGAIFGPSGVYTSSASASASSAALSAASSIPSIPSPYSGGCAAYAGTIASGVISGIAIISIVVAAIFYLRWRRSQAPARAGVEASQPMLNYDTVTRSSIGSPLTMRFYDPDDPTTFPGYQGGPRSMDVMIRSTSSSSHARSGSMLSDMQTSPPPHARGYHGLPMPHA